MKLKFLSKPNIFRKKEKHKIFMPNLHGGKDMYRKHETSIASYQKGKGHTRNMGSKNRSALSYDI
ncbi:MAG: hypothetical protein U9R17_11190 [Thermodesulfobacteriota bacterium]|nr:hypothetical protein [Thermodesulfobacteriota bacterium]